MKEMHTLRTIEEWKTFKHRLSSSLYGLIILKFSPRCPISRSVEQRFESWYGQLPEETPLLCARIDAVNSRPLSHQIATEVAIRHETPQAIWLAPDATILWHASHYSITNEVLDTQLQKFA